MKRRWLRVGAVIIWVVFASPQIVTRGDHVEVLAPPANSDGFVQSPPRRDRLETTIERFRRGFFQGADVAAGYLFDTGDAAGGLHQTHEELGASFALPLGSLDNILALRPYLRFDHLNGPESIDVPETLYNTGVAMFHRKEWTPRLSTTTIVTPSVRSDFNTGDDAFRLFGLILANWQANETLTLSGGAVFLDRADLPVLPALGLLWSPTPDWRWDLTMPRPRISHRLWVQPGQAEAWCYLGATLGGNTWAVRRDDGRSDEFSLRDFRLLTGYELIRRGNRGLKLETGFAFGRRIEYERQQIEIDLDNGLFIEAIWKF